MKRLDALVLTHAQADHEGMALPVIRAYHPRLVVDGGAGWSTPTQRGLPPRTCGAAPHQGQQARSSAAIRLRRPVAAAAAARLAPEGDPNDRAIVALASVGELRRAPHRRRRVGRHRPARSCRRSTS